MLSKRDVVAADVFSLHIGLPVPLKVRGFDDFVSLFVDLVVERCRLGNVKMGKLLLRQLLPTPAVSS